jgi:hypothetical protein
MKILLNKNKGYTIPFEWTVERKMVIFRIIAIVMAFALIGAYVMKMPGTQKKYWRCAKCGRIYTETAPPNCIHCEATEFFYYYR